MNIKFVVVGKLKEKYLKQGIAEYAKRLSRFCKFQVVAVADEQAPESLSAAGMERVKEVEGESLRRLNRGSTFTRWQSRGRSGLRPNLPVS